MSSTLYVDGIAISSEVQHVTFEALPVLLIHYVDGGVEGYRNWGKFLLISNEDGPF